MKMTELYQFMQDNGGAHSFFRYYEVADAAEEANYTGEDRELDAEDMAFYIGEDEPMPNDEEKEDENMELVKIENEQIVTDSRQVAEHFEKQHKHVLESIEKMKAENSALTKMFFPSTYKVEGNRKSYPAYFMNRDGFTLLAMGFTGKKALEWKLKYIEAFNQMETKLNSQPKTQIDILVESAKALQAHERELARLKLTQEEQAESIRVVNARMDTLNGVCTEGTKRQKFVAMVKKYAISNGLKFNQGWHDFHKAYNTAFHTNLKNSMRYYCEKQGIKKISAPDFLERKGYLDDAMRIVDKLLANGKVLLN